MTRAFLALAGSALCASTIFSQSAFAQTQTSKQITIVVGFPPGGGTDIFARLFAQKLTSATGSVVIVENRPGASSTIGAAAVARAAPNGQTLLFTSASLALAKALYAKLPFDPQTDLTPITMTARIPFVLVAHPSLPVRTVRDLLALAKRKPGALDFGSSGTGSAPHLAMEIFKFRSGVDVHHVPYRGAGPNTTAQVSGEVQLSMLIPPVSQPHIAAGRMRALGVTTAKRSSALPDVPTLQEAGIAGYDVPQWHGFFAPANTPSAVIERVYSEIAKSLAAPDVKQRLAAEGADLVGGTPAELGAQLATDVDTYTHVVQRLRLKPE